MKMGAVAVLLSGVMLLVLPESVPGRDSGGGPEQIRFSGSFRPVFYGIETRDRQGDRSREYTLNARLQLIAEYDISQKLTFRTRLAARLSNDQDRMKFVLDGHTQPGGSYPAGTATFDEFELSWRVHPDLLLSAGRFQARFALAGFIPKGVDRYYGSNLSISHTDGVWMRWDPHQSWRVHLVAHHNSSRGSTHAAHAPLDFDKPVARAGGFVNLEHREKDGLWVQRELSVSLLPQSFVRNGKTRNYMAVTTRLMMRLPWRTDMTEFWIGGEAGYVPVSPSPASAGIEVQESRTFTDPSAVAWQISMYANNISGRHRIGLLYGQVEPQWLISSSFRPNNTLSEIRYRFTISERLNFEVRYRFRSDLYRPDGVDFTRQDHDFYTRFTWRF